MQLSTATVEAILGLRDAWLNKEQKQPFDISVFILSETKTEDAETLVSERQHKWKEVILALAKQISDEPNEMILRGTVENRDTGINEVVSLAFSRKDEKSFLHAFAYQKDQEISLYKVGKKTVHACFPFLLFSHYDLIWRSTPIHNAGFLFKGDIPRLLIEHGERVGLTIKQLQYDSASRLIIEKKASDASSSFWELREPTVESILSHDSPCPLIPSGQRLRNLSKEEKDAIKVCKMNAYDAKYGPSPIVTYICYKTLIASTPWEEHQLYKNSTPWHSLVNLVDDTPLVQLNVLHIADQEFSAEDLWCSPTSDELNHESPLAVLNVLHIEDQDFLVGYLWCSPTSDGWNIDIFSSSQMKIVKETKSALRMLSVFLAEIENKSIYFGSDIVTGETISLDSVSSAIPLYISLGFVESKLETQVSEALKSPSPMDQIDVKKLISKIQRDRRVKRSWERLKEYRLQHYIAIQRIIRDSTSRYTAPADRKAAIIALSRELDDVYQAIEQTHGEVELKMKCPAKLMRFCMSLRKFSDANILPPLPSLQNVYLDVLSYADESAFLEKETLHVDLLQNWREAFNRASAICTSNKYLLSEGVLVVGNVTTTNRHNVETEQAFRFFDFCVEQEKRKPNPNHKYFSLPPAIKPKQEETLSLCLYSRPDSTLIALLRGFEILEKDSLSVIITSALCFLKPTARAVVEAEVLEEAMNMCADGLVKPVRYFNPITAHADDSSVFVLTVYPAPALIPHDTLVEFARAARFQYTHNEIHKLFVIYGTTESKTIADFIVKAQSDMTQSKIAYVFQKRLSYVFLVTKNTELNGIVSFYHNSLGSNNLIEIHFAAFAGNFPEKDFGTASDLVAQAVMSSTEKPEQRRWQFMFTTNVLLSFLPRILQMESYMNFKPRTGDKKERDRKKKEEEEDEYEDDAEEYSLLGPKTSQRSTQSIMSACVEQRYSFTSPLLNWTSTLLSPISVQLQAHAIPGMVQIKEQSSSDISPASSDTRKKPKSRRKRDRDQGTSSRYIVRNTDDFSCCAIS